jgi:hypothetical protein
VRPAVYRKTPAAGLSLSGLLRFARNDEETVRNDGQTGMRQSRQNHGIAMLKRGKVPQKNKIA